MVKAFACCSSAVTNTSRSSTYTVKFIENAIQKLWYAICETIWFEHEVTQKSEMLESFPI